MKVRTVVVALIAMIGGMEAAHRRKFIRRGRSP